MIDIPSLLQMNTAQLQQQWREFFSNRPASASREYLLGHLAWQVQAKQHGGLDRDTARQLKQLVQQLQAGQPLAPQNALIIKTGTKLLREYQGRKHEVIVAEKGYRYAGKEYLSLSAIAREITGTRWNGKLFFGVKR